MHHTPNHGDTGDPVPVHFSTVHPTARQARTARFVMEENYMIVPPATE